MTTPTPADPSGGDVKKYLTWVLIVLGALITGHAIPPLSSVPDSYVNKAPVAHATVTCTKNYICDFDASTSTDDSGVVATDWVQATGPKTSIQFDTTTTPLTRLVRVLDKNGAWDTATVTFKPTIGNDPPVALATVVCVDLACTFDGRGSTDDKGITSYKWDDNGTQISVASRFTDVLLPPTTQYSNAYSRTLTVADREGVTNSTVVNFTAHRTSIPLSLVISPHTATINNGGVFQLNAVLTQDPGLSLVPAWNSVDTTVATVVNGNVIAKQIAGTTAIVATAAANGVTVTDTARITVVLPPPPPPPVVALKAIGTSVCTGLNCVMDGSKSTGYTTIEWWTQTGILKASTAVYNLSEPTAGTRIRRLIVRNGTKADSVDVSYTTTAIPGPVTPPSPPPAPVPPPPPPVVIPPTTGGALPITLPASVARIIGPLVPASTTPSQWARYESDFVKFEASHWAVDSSGGGISGTGCKSSVTQLDYTNYYDRAFALYQHWARTGNQTYRDHADAIVKCYRDGYLGPSGAAQAHNLQLEGLAVHYLLTGDTVSKNVMLTAIKRGYPTIPASKLVPNGPGTGENYAYWEGRIQGRYLTGALLAIEIGDVSRNWGAIADSLATLGSALQHADGSYSYQSYVTTNQGTHSNFMIGMWNYSLAQYYRLRSANPVVLTAIKKSLDYLWTTQWCVTGFMYTDATVCNPTTPNGAPDLNGLIVYGYGFYANVTGDLSYQVIGDQIFTGGMNGAYLTGQKQFNQQYRETALYLGLRH